MAFNFNLDVVNDLVDTRKIYKEQHQSNAGFNPPMNHHPTAMHSNVLSQMSGMDQHNHQFQNRDEEFYRYNSSDSEQDSEYEEEDQEFQDRTMSLKDYHGASGSDRSMLDDSLENDVDPDSTAIFALRTDLNGTSNYKKHSSGMLYQDSSTPTSSDVFTLHTPVSLWKS